MSLPRTWRAARVVISDSEITNVNLYGAVGDGVADDTEAIQAAVDDAGAGGTIYLPPGTYVVTSTIAVEEDGVSIIGAGVAATKIKFAPTEAGVCLHFNRVNPSVAPQINYPSVRDMAFYSEDTTYSKTFIRVENAGFTSIRDVQIYGLWVGVPAVGSSGGDGGTVGVYCLGREQTEIRRVMAQAQVPLRFGPNPNETGGSYDMDHLHVSDVTLVAGDVAPSTLTHAAILVDNDTRISNATFDGHQAWVQGAYGFYWSQSTDDGISSQLLFQGVHTEQGTTPSAYSVYIDQSTTNKLINVTFRNCIFGVDRYGVYLKNADDVAMYNCEALHTGSARFLYCDGTLETLAYEGLRTDASPSSALITLPAGVIRSAAGPAPYGSSRAHPAWARYARQETDLGQRRPTLQTGDAGMWAYYTTLAPGGSCKIPVNSDQRSVRVGFVDIVATSNVNTDTIMASGRVAISANDSGNNGATIVFQNASNLLEINGATAGKLSFGCGVRIAADCTLTNNHATQTMKVFIVAWVNRSSEV